MKIFLWALTLLLLFSVPVLATTVPLTFVFQGTINGTAVYRASISGLGITQVGTVTIQDSNVIAGSAGIFSGFDVDALFLDEDGILATTGDQHFASSYLFNVGTIADPGGNVALMPNGAHPGPTFGSLDGTTVDTATATLNSFDAISVADVAAANGFLSLGFGGSLSALFGPEIPVGSSLYLMTGEVGNNGEGLSASVTVSDTRVPEPASLLLLGTGLSALATRLRRK
jgi:hypothetical protein